MTQHPRTAPPVMCYHDHFRLAGAYSLRPRVRAKSVQRATAALYGQSQSTRMRLAGGSVGSSLCRGALASPPPLLIPWALLLPSPRSLAVVTIALAPDSPAAKFPACADACEACMLCSNWSITALVLAVAASASWSCCAAEASGGASERTAPLCSFGGTISTRNSKSSFLRTAAAMLVCCRAFWSAARSCRAMSTSSRMIEARARALSPAG